MFGFETETAPFKTETELKKTEPHHLYIVWFWFLIVETELI